MWLRHSKNRSMLDFESYHSLIQPKGKQEGLTFAEFRRIDFPSGDLPDLYYVLLYVLYGEAALEHARIVLRLPYFKIKASSSQEGPLSRSKVIPQQIHLKI